MVDDEPGPVRRVRIVGTGRAGGSFAAALGSVGWEVDSVTHSAFERESSSGVFEPSNEPEPVDLVLICVPDGRVEQVASSLRVDARTVVLHCSGGLGLDVLAPAGRRASVHPLVALTTVEHGSEALRGAYFGVAGDPMAQEVVYALGGRALTVADEDRSLYHAGAVVASNHLVALMGQVERIATRLDVPVEAYLALARGALGDVERVGARQALTGPVSRGDWETVRRHLASLDGAERESYLALARSAAALAGRLFPDL